MSRNGCKTWENRNEVGSAIDFVVAAYLRII